MTDSSHPGTLRFLFTWMMPQLQQLGFKKTENKTKKWVRLNEGGKQNWKVEKWQAWALAPTWAQLGGWLASWLKEQPHWAAHLTSQSIWLSRLSCQSVQEADLPPDGLNSPTLRQVPALTLTAPKHELHLHWGQGGRSHKKVWIPSLFRKIQGLGFHGTRNTMSSYKANVEEISSDQTFQVEGKSPYS